MAQLSVYKDENGKPQVECPGCGEFVSPSKNPILDSYECPECDIPIHSGDMKKYKKEMNKWKKMGDYFDE